eukprot:jgi/Botrbrau1/23508/Bobra.106_1s0059.1
MTILNCYNVSADGTGVYVFVNNPDNSGDNYKINLSGAKTPEKPKLVWQGGFPPLDSGSDRRDLWLPQSYEKAAAIRVTQDFFLDETDSSNILLQLWNADGKLGYVLLPYHQEKKQGYIYVDGNKDFQVIIESDKVTIFPDSKFSDNGLERQTFFLSKGLKEYAKRSTASKM